MITLGTSNPGKLRELTAVLRPVGVELQAITLDVPEPHDTFEANAEAKALAYAGYARGVAIAEDSGLVVPALGGLPGVWSARFADLDLATRTVRASGRKRDELDRANTARLLQMLEGFELGRRRAYYKIVLVVARPGEVLFRAEGECHGAIGTEPRGTDGFGYDPVFLDDAGGGRTFAEVPAAEKNQRSHRRRALDQFIAWLGEHPEVR